MTTLLSAALTVLRPHVAAMRSYAATHPMPPVPRTRTWPTTNFVWRRYLSSMITSMTRSTNELWDGLRADAEWNALRKGGPRECPSRPTIERFLRGHGIRFPAQKAARIRSSIDRDFEGLAIEMRQTFAQVHDRRRDRVARREAEVRLSVLIQEELKGCGVAPKIARLLIMGATEVQQVIPIDSRWMSALDKAGYELNAAALANEKLYRPIEDVLCEASYRLGVTPATADGVPFGWLFNEGV